MAQAPAQQHSEMRAKLTSALLDGLGTEEILAMRAQLKEMFGGDNHPIFNTVDGYLELRRLKKDGLEPE